MHYTGENMSSESSVHSLVADSPLTNLQLLSLVKVPTILLFALSMWTNAFSNEPPTTDSRTRTRLEWNYLGHISLPKVRFQKDRFGNADVRGAFAYCESRDVFAIATRKGIAEVSNPGPGSTATIVTAPRNITADLVAQHGVTRGHPFNIYGMTWDEVTSKYYFTVEMFYNVGRKSNPILGKCDAGLTNATGLAFTGLHSQKTAGHICRVPAIGNKWLMVGRAAAHRTNGNWGDSAYLVNGAEIGDGNTVAHKTLFEFTKHNKMPGWRAANQMHGAAYLPTRRLLVVCGMWGSGPEFYGMPNAFEQRYGFAPAKPNKSYHADPYSGRFLVYSWDDLTQGIVSPEHINADFTLQNDRKQGGTGWVRMTGLAFDRKRDRLYVCESLATAHGKFELSPVIHVLALK